MDAETQIRFTMACFNAQGADPDAAMMIAEQFLAGRVDLESRR
jgi:hypothetical protein